MKKGLIKKEKTKRETGTRVRETRAQNSLSVPPGRRVGQYQRQIHFIITFGPFAAERETLQLTPLA